MSVGSPASGRSTPGFSQRNVCKDIFAVLPWTHGTHRRLSRPRGPQGAQPPGPAPDPGPAANQGGATATTLAARLGLNSGATSYHLRQLEKAGFIVEDEERGNGRDRWWRAAHQATRADSTTARTPEEQDTYDGYLQAVAISYHDQLQQSLTERRVLPPAWHDAWDMSDWNIRLTAARAKALLEAVHALIEEYGEDAEDDDDAETFRINVNAFVRPGTVVAEDES